MFHPCKEPFKTTIHIPIAFLFYNAHVCQFRIHTRYYINLKYIWTFRLLKNISRMRFFSIKKAWKIIISKSVEHIETCEWIVRNDTESTDRTIINIQSDLYSGSLLWEAAQAYPHMLRNFAFLARLCTLSSTNSDTYCRHCHLAMQDGVEHFFIDCKSLQLRRELFLNTVTDNYCSIELAVTLYNMSNFDFTCAALGRRLPSIDILDNYLLLSHFAIAFYGSYEDLYCWYTT